MGNTVRRPCVKWPPRGNEECSRSNPIARGRTTSLCTLQSTMRTPVLLICIIGVTTSTSALSKLEFRIADCCCRGSFCIHVLCVCVCVLAVASPFSLCVTQISELSLLPCASYLFFSNVPISFHRTSVVVAILIFLVLPCSARKSYPVPNLQLPLSDFSGCYLKEES